MLRKNSLIIICMIMLCSMISASGLTLTTSNFQVNKTYGLDKTVYVQLKNNEAFPFYNVSIESNNFIKIPNIPVIQSGQTLGFNVTITANDDFNKNFKIYGFYEAQLGSSNKTYDINVDFNDGLSKCDFSIIEGDTVKWKSLVSVNEIILKNIVTGANIKTLNFNETHSILFSNEQIFKYYFLSAGFVFTDTCTITVLNSEGLINNPEYDANLTLNVSLEYNPTGLIVSVLTNSYEMDYNSQQDGILSVTNVGNATAKKINLIGDWFSFSENNFDLNPGYTKNIGYTISPQIFTTNQTNINYTKNISITGNFEKVSKNFNVFIKYSNIVNPTYSGKSFFEIFISMKEMFCSENPNDEMCQTGSQVIYANETQNAIEATDEMWRFLFEIFADTKEKLKYQSAQISEYTNISEQVLNQSVNDKQNSDEIKNSIEGIKISIYFIVIFFATLIVCGILTVLIYHYLKRKNIKRFSNY